MLRIWPIQQKVGSAAELAGTVLDVGSSNPPRFVVITNRGGIVRGLGNLTRQKSEHEAQWYGYVAHGLPQTYTAFAALEDGSFCRLGGLRGWRKRSVGRPLNTP